MLGARATTDSVSCMRNIWNAPNGLGKGSAMEINLLIKLILPNWPFLSCELVGSIVFALQQYSLSAILHSRIVIIVIVIFINFKVTRCFNV